MSNESVILMFTLAAAAVVVIAAGVRGMRARALPGAAVRNSAPRFHNGAPVEGGLLPLQASDANRSGIEDLWKWLVGPAATLAHVTVFGDLIFRDGQGRLVLVDVAAGDAEVLGEEQDLGDVTTHPAVRRLLRPELVAEVAKRRPTLAPDDVLDWIQPPAMGGAEVIENLQCIKLISQQCVLASIHRSAREPK